MEQRRPSFTTEELTPIVLSQLQTTTKKKEESRRQRRENARTPNSVGAKSSGNNVLEVPSAATSLLTGDSGSESCGEESRMKTAEAFMSGIQSALEPNQQLSNAATVPSGAAGGISTELASEVECVLSKLMCSVDDANDPSLVPLIASLQASLKTAIVKPQLQKQHSAPKSPSSAGTTTSSSSGGGGGSGRDWLSDPFGSLPKRPQQSQAEVASRTEFEPRMARTFNPTQRTKTATDADEGEQPGESHVASKIPWKIRAARKRQMKHHTTGMTKEEFAQIRESLKESAVKCECGIYLALSTLTFRLGVSVTPRPVESYAITRNQSEGSILRNKENDEEDEEVEDEDGAVANNDKAKLPTSYQQKEGNRAYTDAAKSVDNTYKSSDLGYASDVCDYNVSKNKQDQQRQVRREQPFSRPVSQLVSPHLKPTSPRLESSLYARRMRLIRKRASVFNGANEDNCGGDELYFNHPTNHYDNLSHAGKSTSSAVPMPLHGVTQTPPTVNNLKSDLSLARLNSSSFALTPALVHRQHDLSANPQGFVIISHG